MKTLILFILSSLLSLIPSAEAQLVCPERGIEQITSELERDSSRPSINADGTRITFFSFADINSGNPDGNAEIYLFDSNTGIITQITDTTGFIGNLDPSINSNGTKIAFASNAIAGNNGGPEDNFQIFLFDTTSGIFTQITDTMGGRNSFDPSINADGTRIAFDSNANIGGGNPDGNVEIYLFDTTSGIFTQITDTAAGRNSFSPSINADGTRIAFVSRANINGGNPDGNQEIYLFDTNTGLFTQITDTMGGRNSFDSSINADGTLIAFSSNANINGGNPDGNQEIYLFDTDTGITTQITDGNEGNSNEPSINADGTRIAFKSDANINGGNPANADQIYVFDTQSGQFIQLTFDQEENSDQPSINADGTWIAFSSSANINGGNPDDNDEIYLARCIDPVTARNIPTMSEWALVGLAAAMGVFGILYAVSRRTAADA